MIHHFLEKCRAAMDTLSPRQFANSMHRRREALVFRFPRSLANLHGFFFLLFSPYPLSFSTLPRWYKPACRCCWPVRFLALKIYSLYKWNPMSHAPRPLLAVIHVASPRASGRAHSHGVCAPFSSAVEYNSRFEPRPVGRKSWRNNIDTRIGRPR